MIDIKRLEKDEIEETGLSYKDRYNQDLKNRGGEPNRIEKVLVLNSQKKSLIAKTESARAKQNKVGQEIAVKKREKKDASDLLQEMQSLSIELKEMNQGLIELTEQLKTEILHLPNHCHPSVPVGSSEDDNVQVRIWGEKREFSFEAKEHVDLGESLDILDFERASKVAGARFAFLKGLGARLERALIQFMMDEHSSHYTEMIPPFIVNGESLQGTGQFPKFKEDVFNLHEHDYYMIPTAEVPLTNYYSGEILSASDLPQKFVAFSPCFRSEAGSYGRDTKGLIRQHQFNKVELLKFCHPDESYEEHEKLTQDAEHILQKLGLHYRVMSLCTKDIGFGAAKCYDLEVWLPGQKNYREISSCSNFEDYQARRANIRFRSNPGKPRFVHTINGSGLAVGRTVIAILENYQREDGRIEIPKCLQPYMGHQNVI